MYYDEFNIKSKKNKKFYKISPGASFRKSKKLKRKSRTKIKNNKLIGIRTYDGRKLFLKEVA
tara:strand:- start:198 stop:383 length:186 start_codon:yes stop_codon:yes gene_type:complete